MVIWDAIKDMRRRSELGQSFAFTYMSCNTTGRKSEGVVEVLHGRFLSREDVHHHRNAEIVERYIDLDTMEVRHFYQPLLMTYDGQKLSMI